MEESCNSIIDKINKIENITHPDSLNNELTKISGLITKVKTTQYQSFDEFKKDPNAQEQYQQALRAENERALRQNNIPVTPLNGYLMHFAGASKGEALIKAKDDQPLENFFSESTIISACSGDIFGFLYKSIFLITSSSLSK
jgi:hypothetical protein